MQNEDDLLDRINVDSKVMVGKPTIKGTTISVEYILRLLASGQQQKDILQNYPDLKQEDLHAALLYAAKIIAGEETCPYPILKFIHVKGKHFCVWITPQTNGKFQARTTTKSFDATAEADTVNQALKDITKAIKQQIEEEQHPTKEGWPQDFK